MIKTFSFLFKTARVGLIRKTPPTCLRRFQSSISTEDKAFIVQKINERDLPSSLGASNVSKIVSYVEKNKLNTLEDLLVVKGIGPKLIRKVCDAILAAKEGIDHKPEPRKKRDIQYVIPSMEDIRKKRISTVVGLHIGHENISWSAVDTTSKTLNYWDLIESTPPPENMVCLLKTVGKVLCLLPKGDLYIMEEGHSGRQRNDFKSLLTAMFVSAIQISRGDNVEDLSVALVKPSLKNRQYGCIVGSERVSLQGHVMELLEERSTTDCLSISSELKEMYLELKPSQREDLAHTLLLVTAFANIILHQRSL